MSEPYTNLMVVEYPPTIVSLDHRDASIDLFMTKLCDWLDEHCPSCSTAEVVGIRSCLKIKVVIPDPDEALAYRMRWT